MTQGTVTTPKGFVAAGTTAGIKSSGNSDMALVVNEGPEFNAAAVYTRNRVKASPVKVSREATSNGQLAGLHAAQHEPLAAPERESAPPEIATYRWLSRPGVPCNRARPST